jgi:HD-GYP domain-containing protein (c-di-GMP phosphodiesterase class II)
MRIPDTSQGLIPLVIAGILSVATYRICNTGIFAFYRYWRFGRPPLSGWLQNIAENWPSQLIAAPLAVALAAVAENTGNLESRLALTAAYLIALPIARQEYGYYLKSQQMLHEIVESMVRALEGVDPAARAHGDRVSALAVETGRRLGMSERALLALGLASRLHDVGMLSGPEGPSAEEHHAAVGSRILGQFPDPLLAEFVRGHHERWDGQGVPDHKQGTAIPLGARIIAAAEIYDSALAGLAPFEAPRSPQAAADHMISLAGTALDPKVVMTLLRATLDEATKHGAAG